MFRNAYQRGLLSVFYSSGSNPLCNLWETHMENGYIKRNYDKEIKALVFEICGANVSTTYMTCPSGNKVLGIFMPFMIMIVKNLKKYFSFEVTILDDGGRRRRFRLANFQSTTQITPFCTVMPIGLVDGWNQIQFNLADFTRRAYNTKFMEVQNLKINANIGLRRIYFAEKLYSDEELPKEYKLLCPLSSKVKRTSKPKDTTDIKVSISAQILEVQQQSLEEVRNIEKGSKLSIPDPPERVSEHTFFTKIIPASTIVIAPDMGSELTVVKTDSMTQSTVFKTGLTDKQEASADGMELLSRANVEISTMEAPVEATEPTPTAAKAEQSEAEANDTEHTEEVAIIDDNPENIDKIPEASADFIRD